MKIYEHFLQLCKEYCVYTNEGSFMGHYLCLDFRLCAEARLWDYLI
jgi:hypothetical protein